MKYFSPPKCDRSELLNLTSMIRHLSNILKSDVFIAGGIISNHYSPYAGEHAIVEGAKLSRKMEFYAGRHYARRALALASYPPGEILRGEKGNPIWPSGVIGSITHDKNLALAVVTHDVNFKGVGIDLVVSPSDVELTLLSIISSQEEISRLKKNCLKSSPLATVFNLA